MDDWTPVLAALGIPVALAVPLSVAARYAIPALIHFIRVWMVDRGLRWAAGLMHSMRVTAGTAATALSGEDLIRLVDAGVAYMRDRLGETLDALKIDAASLRVMVQAEYGELLAKQPVPAPRGAVA